MRVQARPQGIEFGAAQRAFELGFFQCELRCHGFALPQFDPTANDIGASNRRPVESDLDGYFAQRHTPPGIDEVDRYWKNDLQDAIEALHGKRRETGQRQADGCQASETFECPRTPQRVDALRPKDQWRKSDPWIKTGEPCEKLEKHF